MKRQMTTIIVILALVVLFTRPALAKDINSQKLEFVEKLGDNAETTYFDPSNSTPLPILVNMTDGEYKGPEFPFAAVKIPIKDDTIINIDFDVNLSYQDIMSGVWDWKILLPASFDVNKVIDWSFYIDGQLVGNKQKTYTDHIHCGVGFNIKRNMSAIIKTENTKYGLIFEVWDYLAPTTHHFLLSIETENDITVYLTRETQPAILTIEAASTVQYHLNMSYAFLFKKAVCEQAMGALITDNLVLGFKEYMSNSTQGYYTTVGLPAYLPSDTSVQITMYIFNYSTTYLNDTHPTTVYLTQNFSSNGFYYIFQSTPRPQFYSDNPGHGYTVFFYYKFSKPVKLLFAWKTTGITGDSTFVGDNNPYVGIYIKNGTFHTDKYTVYLGWQMTYAGIVFYHELSHRQYAYVQYMQGKTIYDFGFAKVYLFSKGNYIIVPQGNYETWVEIKNVTIKSLGAKIDDLLFGGSLEFSSHNDIISYIIGSIKKIISLGKEILEFLKHIGEIIWQYLMKFVKWILDMISCITDALGGIFNYILFILIPISLMFIISFISRFGKKFNITEEVRA